MGKEERRSDLHISNIPGPGSYSLKSSIGNGAKITISPKIVNKLNIVFPGPGAYYPKTEAILENVPRIGMSYASRAEIECAKQKFIPGPGAYSTFESVGGPSYTFGSGSRIDFSKGNTNPGPGNYNINSIIPNLPVYERSKKK